MNKKGFAVQFNWIFVLVAGGVFFLFFINIINNKITSEESYDNLKLTDELNTVLKVSGSNTNTEKDLSFKGTLFFTCENDASEYYVNERGLKTGSYDFNAIFSPSTLDGKDMLLKTNVMLMPFKLMPFVYVTNTDIVYVVVSSDQVFSNYILDLLPDTANKESVSPGESFQDKGFDRTVFITDSGSGISLNGFSANERNSRVFSVIVRSNSEIVNGFGEASFLEYKNSNWNNVGKSFFMGDDFLLGAIIGHDKNLYDCQVKKIMNRLSLLTTLHKNRINNVYNVLVQDPLCKAYYAAANNELEKMQTLAQKGQAGLSLELQTNIGNLRRLNTELLRERGECPLLY